MVRYHTCGSAIWIQKTWDGMKHYRVYFDPDTKKHITHCPLCQESLRGAVLRTKPPFETQGEWNWLWSRLREELGAERANQLHSEWRQRQQTRPQESRQSS